MDTAKSYKGIVVPFAGCSESSEKAGAKLEEAVLNQLVETYELDVPKAMVDNEVNGMVCQLYQQMRYDALRTGEPNFFIQRDIEAQMDSIRETACREVKIDLILREVIATEQLQITREELEAEAAAMARRQGTTVEQIKGFFGEDLDMLRNDLLIRKAIDFICAHAVIQ